MKLERGRLGLEQEADLARAKLIGTIGELDRRRHELLDLKLQLRRHASDLLSIAAGLVVGIGATSAVLIAREHRRERRLREERLHAIGRLWQHPERVAPRGSVVGTIIRMALVALAAMATTTVGSRQIERFRRRPRLPAPPSEPIGV